MKIIAIHEAKTHLSRYLKAVGRGETIVIAHGRRPIAKLVPLDEPTLPLRPKVGETMDSPMEVPAEALAPMTHKELNQWSL